MLWKNRDTRQTSHNELAVLPDGDLFAIGLINAGSEVSIWMGMNEAGFCIENSLSPDLKDEFYAEGGERLGNGQFMKLALQTCANLDDFRDLLRRTNERGRSTLANFGVIDADGGASLFETGPTTFTEFDANDPTLAPRGYIIRSNFATTAHGLHRAGESVNPDIAAVNQIYSADRYCRARELFSAAPAAGIDARYVLRHLARDLADSDGNPIPGSVNAIEGSLPKSIDTTATISRTTTVSAAVLQGVRPGEPASLTAMWTMLGDPKFSIAVPCWIGGRTIADPLEDDRGAELGELAITLRDWSMNERRTAVHTTILPGIWEDLWALEDQLFVEARGLKDRWSAMGFTVAELAESHRSLAAKAMAAMEEELAQAKAVALRFDPSEERFDPVERLNKLAHRSAVAPAKAVRSSVPVHVAIYDHGDGSARGPRELLAILSPESGYEARRVSPQGIRAGVLDNFDVLIVPGGSASKQSSKLKETGRQAIQKFVSAGGGYIGICAGAYLASSQYAWSLDLINARVWDRAHWARGTGTVSLQLSEAGRREFVTSAGEPPGAVERSELVNVHYGQGPLLVPGDDPDLPRYHVLASYADEIAKRGAPEGAMCDTHAIIRSNFGEGRVICFSPHPERKGGPEEMIRRGVDWAAAVNAW